MRRIFGQIDARTEEKRKEKDFEIKLRRQVFFCFRASSAKTCCALFSAAAFDL